MTFFPNTSRRPPDGCYFASIGGGNRSMSAMGPKGSAKEETANGI